MNDNQQPTKFRVVNMGPAKQEAKRRQLRCIGWILGCMIGLGVLLSVAMISYSVGYHNGEHDTLRTRQTSRTQPGDGATKSTEIPETAAAYQSQDRVGQGQIPDHYRGEENDKVVAIEYADFTCSHCIALAPKLDAIYDKYGDKVQFIYRHYNVGFTYSDVTAKLSEAAYLVGGEDSYWRMSAKLFADKTFGRGDYLTTDQLNDKIRQLGRDIDLDGDKLLDAYSDSANNGIQAKLDRDQELARQSGVDGTPSWFINRQSVPGTAEAISGRLAELVK